MSLSSVELQCKMKFAVYLPPKAETDKCPVFYWLSGKGYATLNDTNAVLHNTAYSVCITTHLNIQCVQRYTLSTLCV